jgi:hypothetical protein
VFVIFSFFLYKAYYLKEIFGLLPKFNFFFQKIKKYIFGPKKKKKKQKIIAVRRGCQST